MAVDSPELDLDGPGLLRTTWYPWVLESEGVLPIILLLAGSSLANGRDSDPTATNHVEMSLIELKSQSLFEIRQMVGNPAQNHGDNAIAAVMKMASYAPSFVSTDACHLHMRALARMVAGRGGFDSLGLRGLLARLICWVDYDAACLIGTQP